MKTMRNSIFIIFMLLAGISFSRTINDKPDFRLDFDKFPYVQKHPDQCGYCYFPNINNAVKSKSEDSILNQSREADTLYNQFKAENDNEFDNGSGIILGKLNKNQIRNLAELGQVWGFLKYHHPAVASGKYSWDYELFRILPKLQYAGSKEKRQELLMAWIDSLGIFKQRKYADTQSARIAIKPDLKWIESSRFNQQLKDRLMAIKNAERTGQHFYIGNTESENPDFKNENPYPAMHYPDTGFRLLALFRYWNMIQYYFPYKYLIDDNWNDVLTEFIPVFINAPDETQYKLAALKLIARINDTHGGIYGDSVLENYFGERNAAVQLSFIGNKAVVTGFHDKILGEQSGLKNGDIIEKINGRPLTGIIKELLPITPASNYPTQLRQISGKLLRTNDSLIAVGYKRDRKQAEIILKTYDGKSLRIPRRNQRPDTCFRLIRSDIAYLYPGSVKNSYLPEIIPQILKSKGLIVDFRCYPSDNLVDSFADILLPSSREFVKFSSAKVNDPGLFEFLEPIRTGKDNPDYFKGQVVILINEITQSAAEYTAMAFRTAPKVKVIGSTTAGADGDTSPIFLPGGIITHISGLGVYYPDGRETQRVGILPDIQVKPTIKAISENRDELIEKAMEIIDEN